MKKITIPSAHLLFLKTPELRDLYVDGLVSLLDGSIPETTKNSSVDEAIRAIGKDTFNRRTLDSLPPVPVAMASLSKPWQGRFELVSNGLVPSTSLNNSYRMLKLKPISQLSKEHLNKIYTEGIEIVRDRSNDTHRKWVEYIILVLEHCADNDLVVV